MKKLGLVIHQHRSEVIDLAASALKWCDGAGIEPSMPHADAELVQRTDLGVSETEFGRHLDVCLSLGGDGTMLRAVALVAANGVPILGVNAGHLGYLSEIDPADMITALDQWLAEVLRIERRMMIDLSVVDASGERAIGVALNEVVVDRSESGRAVEVLVTINGEDFITHLTDALIVATPTGSTAYSLSAGGPIVEPNFRTLLLTPVAAHTVFNRPMVLAPDTEVVLTVKGHRNGVVSVDGQPIMELEPGQSVICRASAIEAKLLIRGDRDFHSVLKEKFGLGGR